MRTVVRWGSFAILVGFLLVSCGGSDGGGGPASGEDAVADSGGTGGGADAGGACDGIACDQPPVTACLDGTTLRAWAPLGTCVNGGCVYTPVDTPCAHGCDAATAGCVGCGPGCPAAGGGECSAGQRRTCTTRADGCLVWTAWQACPSGVCADTASCGTCTNGCPVDGAGECANGLARTCAADASGCLAWGAWEACTDGFCLNATTCGACAHGCATLGATECTGGQLRTCASDANGCRAWSAWAPCADGFCAGATACGACTDTCPTEGATECADGRIRSCEADANGCLAWATWRDCAAGFCADGGSCGECDNGCPASGATECTDGQRRVCGADAEGCLAWSAFVDCADGFCASATACGVCQHGCPALNATECADGRLRTCGADANGCRAWSAFSNCPDGFCASGTACGACSHGCGPLGATACADGSVRTCVADANGCRVWSSAVACEDGFCASGTACGVCAGGCPAAGATACEGGRIRTCVADDDGCLSWSAWSNCADAFCASATSCGACGTPCPSGASECVDGERRVCGLDGNGCFVWGDFAPCADGFCADELDCGVCPAGCDTPGDTTCADGALTTCVSDGNDCPVWGAPEDCADGLCRGDADCGQAPAAAVVCPADVTVGEAATVNAGGSSDADGVLVDYAFEFGDGAVADGPYESAEHTWESAGEYTVTVTVTDDDGATDSASCTVSVARFTWPDRTISADTELCGEVFVGRLTIQGGATVTCPGGTLDIHADQVFVDPASAIDLSRVSSESSGRGPSICSRACACDTGFTGGSGGGNGTSGAASPSTSGTARSPEMGGCLGSCVSYTCSGSSGGGARGYAHDLSAPLGGRGGGGCEYVVYTCSTPFSGGLGGGSVRILANESITLLGAILVDGEDGRSEHCAGGGGAGGSIVLGAPALSVTGQLSAAGGTGGTGGRPTSYYGGPANGGDGAPGRVKLLHGDTLDASGTIDGVEEVVSVLPPLFFRSPTHPEPALVYNDTFEALTVAWDAPFAAATGYWYALDRNEALALTPGNGTFTADTSLTFARDAFPQPGAWYLHVVTVDGAATTGSVANHFTVHVNSTPHTVTSSSHPSESAWYANTAIALSWEPPAGAAPESFDRFWYRLDRVSGTSPAAAQSEWTATTNTQLVLTADATGAPIDGFAYHFHLVAEDTQGNLTARAAHFRVQVGAEPATLSVFGYVRDAVGTALEGAAVRFEPYGLTATTDPNGYFLLEGVYEGDYVLQVAKDGFAPYEAPVVVNADAVPMAITLEP